jgi:iron(II)-dependent oxidoreductase
MNDSVAGESDQEQAGREAGERPAPVNIDVSVDVKENQGDVSGVTLPGNIQTVNIYTNQGVAIPGAKSQAAFERKEFDLETILIPKGTFLMGRQRRLDDIHVYETPQEQIELPAFRIGVCPVSNREYAEYVRQERLPVPPELNWEGQKPAKAQLDCPVRSVTWQEALDYCAWLKKQTGHDYSLPSEAQWEMAARGPDGRLYPWGNEWQDGRSNQGNKHIAAVRAFKAQSVYGLYDLVGNVLQWTTTLWGEKRLQPDEEYALPWRDDGRDDLTANRQIRRVVRGSTFNDPIGECICARRRSFLPADRGGHAFRVIIRL